jgi:hypothetical protein
VIGLGQQIERHEIAHRVVGHPSERGRQARAGR